MRAKHLIWGKKTRSFTTKNNNKPNLNDFSGTWEETHILLGVLKADDDRESAGGKKGL